MKLTALAGAMVSNGRHIIIGRVGKYYAPSSPRSALNGKDQDLRPCFLYIKLRQGRSLWLPTLPYQKTNRYAVDGAKLVFYLLLLRIGYTNRYAVVGVMPTFFTPPLHRLYQPLRGRWRNVSVCFTLPSHLLHQPPRGSWHNTSNMCMGC